MRRYLILGAALIVGGCSGDDANNSGTDASTDAHAQADTSLGDSGNGSDSAAQDTGSDTSAVDSGGDASDAGVCAASWTIAPSVDTSIALPDGGGRVLIHASATGTQDYTCLGAATDAGTTYSWKFVGPEADLNDCRAIKIGSHFASDAGATRPEWMTTIDNSFVIAKKVNGFDASATAVPWLLLQSTSSGGAGPISTTLYVHRVNTTGGIAPTAACDANTNLGTTQKVAYTADYYFYGP